MSPDSGFLYVYVEGGESSMDYSDSRMDGNRDSLRTVTIFMSFVITERKG
jgi:hypothetical protein